jgi:hypothetical protein
MSRSAYFSMYIPLECGKCDTSHHPITHRATPTIMETRQSNTFNILVGQEYDHTLSHWSESEYSINWRMDRGNWEASRVNVI